jgi:hypothetical protein
MPDPAWNMVWWLIVGHAIMDFWAQSDALAQLKNRNIANTRGPGAAGIWPYALTSHSLHHGAAVAIVTGSVWLGVAETVSHWAIDFGKCENWYGIHVDQAAHVACKIAWCYIAFHAR